jgi:hypothetical protein
MKKAWIAVAAVALVVLPGTAGAHRKGPDVKNAAKYCKSLRAEMGVEAFRAAYGGRPNAFGKCVSKRVHEVRDARKAARQACAEELGVKRFRPAGEDKPAKPGKAFRDCVRAKTQADTSDDDEHVVNAAKLCKAEREQDEDAFRNKYGTNHNKRNAFGKCVSKHAREAEAESDADKTAEPSGS